MTQAQALNILKTGANVFLTGEPGSGKTHLVNQYVAYLRKVGVEPAITASTGIAATHIGGMTIHSWSGIGIKRKLDKYDLDRIASTARLANRIRRTRVLIIDEVSMLSSDTLSMVDAVCREVNRNELPFGGIQAVLVGDFFQLPPVEESVNKFAYNCPVWEEANLLFCYLSEQYRQEDSNFLNILSAIRSNTFNNDHLGHLNGRKTEAHLAPEKAPKLFSHNVDVDRVNREMLSKLPGKQESFIMSSKGKAALVETLKKGCLSPETLELKVGASVMFTKNNTGKKFVNGTLGTVDGFHKYSNYPIVKTRRGNRIEVEPMDWTVEEDGRVRARITQLPLRLAWAITVHKSQGMSLDEAVMDLSQVFEFGQGYVALSRVRQLSGVHLLDWNERAFQVHPEVLAKDANFRAQSESAAHIFADMPAKDLTSMHNQFITSILPVRRSLGAGGQNTRIE